jgi:hypothetical protein
MCDVHLVPEVDEMRVAGERLQCGECKKPIARGKPYRFIEGLLDDESGERYRYVAHDDCYLLSMSDVGSSGCFLYGGAHPVPRCEEPVRGAGDEGVP